VKHAYDITSGADQLKDYSVTFANNSFWMTLIAKTKLHLEVYVPASFDLVNTKNIRWIPSMNPFYDFVLYHNKVNEDRHPDPNSISPSAWISHYACIGNEGLRYAKKGNELVKMKHMGNVVIGDGVVVGPQASIARGTFGPTTIFNDVKIDAGVHIGHNCRVGENTLIVEGTALLGSVSVGSGCFISGNAVLRNGISIASNTFIGMGAVVTKSIMEEGYSWIGNPAKRHKRWHGEI